MQSLSPFLATGTPRFDDSRVALCATAQGLQAAWSLTFASATDNAAQVAKVMKEVRGDFAVGIQLVDGTVVLAVDRFAIQTLCYRIADGQLQFAARADDVAGNDGQVDPQAIFDYLYFHVIPSPRTIFKGVMRLPAGHFAMFKHGTITVAPYWVPTFEELRNASFDELKSEFRSLLKNAVATQLDGGKPGCFLSGGTDSSTVAGMISEASGKQAATYSIGFDAQGYDEMEFARIAAKRFNTEHHEYYVTPDDLVRSIPSVAAHYDQPFGNSSALPAYYCAKMARDSGVTKILAGDGGDELFGGNTRYAKQRVFGWYDSIPIGLRTSVLEPLCQQSFMDKIPLIRKGASYVNQAKVPMPDRMMTYNLVTRLGLKEVLSPAFLSQVDTEAPARQQRSLWGEARTDSLVNRMLAFDWRYTLADCDLPKVMGTTSLAELKVGFPMLDDDLLAFSQRLPTSYKLKGLKLRWFFKEALKGFLPDEIITKKKQGFGLPFGVWANQTPTLKSLASNSLESLSNRGLVRPAFVKELLTERLAEHSGYYGEMIWILMMLEQWLQAKAPNFKVQT